MRLRLVTFLSIILLAGAALKAEEKKFAVKTNLAYDLTLSPNIGAEVKVGDKSTIQATLTFNPWTFSDGMKMNFYLLSPEYRYWFDSSFKGFFVGGQLIGGQYHFSRLHLPFGLYPGNRDDSHHKGYVIGGGLVAGYSWNLCKDWSLEPVVGLGCLYTNYRIEDEGKPNVYSSRTYFGPTQLALNLVYHF